MTIGNQLKNLREKKHLEKDDVYQQTHIHPNVLTALEEDRYESIPNRIYIRSFLKEYSSFLGLDVDEILSEYDELHPKQAPGAVIHPYERKKAVKSSINIDKLIRYTKIVLIAVVSAVAIFYLFKFSAWTRETIKQKLDERAARIEAINKEKERESKKNKVSTVTPPAPKQPEKPPTKKPTQKAPAPKDGKLEIAPDEKLQLKITVTDDVWIQLKADGNIISQIVLKKGTTETWQADQDFTLWTGNAAAMELELNGYNLDSLGGGVKRDIIINREGLKK